MKKIAIPTLHPNNKGGVLSMMQVFYQTVAELNHQPTLMALSEDRPDHQSFRRPFGPAKNSYQTLFDMDTTCIGVRWGYLEYGNYLFNLDLWQTELEKFDLFFAVSGTAICTLPLVRLNKPFVIWAATIYEEDRIDREKQFPLLKKIVDKFSKPRVLEQEKIAYQQARKIFALSQYTQESITRKYPEVADKIEVLNYPINTELFAPLAVSQPTDKRYIISVARFSDPRKNVRLLIEAFFEVAENYPDLHLRLMGDKPDAEWLDYINASPFAERIELLGHVSDVQEIVRQYQQATIFVLPSLQEGLGIVVLEAMSCGLPVISTRCGGPESVIDHGRNGFLVDNNNLPQMVSAIKHVFDGQVDLASIGLSARDTIVERFNLQRFREQVGKTLSILETV